MNPPAAVLITGASRGLGRAIAGAVAAAGYPVVVACRRGEDASAVAKGIATSGGCALGIEVDVTDYDQVADAVARTVRWSGGHLAGVVNNAGIISPIAPIAEADPHAWSQLIQTNLVGPFHGIRAALPHIEPDGVVVNISSGAVHSPHPGWSAYSASKAGLAMLTRAVHMEYGDRISCYGVQPGIVDTDMQAEVRASMIGPMSVVPRSDLSPPDRASRVVAWLIKTRPRKFAGQEVDVDHIQLAQSR